MTPRDEIEVERKAALAEYDRTPRTWRYSPCRDMFVEGWLARSALSRPPAPATEVVINDGAASRVIKCGKDHGGALWIDATGCVLCAREEESRLTVNVILALRPVLAQMGRAGMVVPLDVSWVVLLDALERFDAPLPPAPATEAKRPRCGSASRWTRLSVPFGEFGGGVCPDPFHATLTRERDAMATQYENAMEVIHRNAGARRDGLCGILSWIDATKAALASARTALAEAKGVLRVLRDRINSGAVGYPYGLLARIDALVGREGGA